MSSIVRQTAAVLMFALAGVAGAASDRQHLADERTQAASCAAINWNQELMQPHPDRIDACPEPGSAVPPAEPIAARITSKPPAPTLAARRDPLPARLPTTAGLLSWVAILGSFSLLGALALTLSRNA